MTQAQSTIRRRRSSAAPETTAPASTPVSTPAPEAPAPVSTPAPEPEAPASEAPAATPGAITTQGALALPVVPENVALAFANAPADDAPVTSVAPAPPALSYKMPRPGMPLQWVVSTDGGKNNAETGMLVLKGVPVDLRLEISAATWRKGETDYRLRFQFIDAEGFLSEVNLNAINPAREDPTQRVITGPARSLLGGLMTASESEDDMQAVMGLVRLTLKSGNKGGSFVDLDVPDGGGGWHQFTGSSSTMKVEQGPYGLAHAVATIKERFNAAGFLAGTPAVIGQVPHGSGQPGVVPVLVDAQVVD